MVENRYTLLCAGCERSELQRGASRKHMQPGASCCAASGLACACTRTTATMQPHMLASSMQTTLYSACPEKTCQVRLHRCVFAVILSSLIMPGLTGLPMQRSLPCEVLQCVAHDFSVYATGQHCCSALCIDGALLV